MSEYPAGPYGLSESQIIKNMKFMGFRDGTGPYTELSLSDYYDPDGTKGIKALFITLGWNGCGASVNQADQMKTYQTLYTSQGLRQLSALHGDLDNPAPAWVATESTAQNWIKTYGITYDVVIDPTYKLNNGVKPASDPHGWFVNPKTMQITVAYPGDPSIGIWEQGWNALL